MPTAVAEPTSANAVTSPRPSEVDVVVVGAGFAGMYLLKRLRDLGFATRVLEAGGGVGGTWYWNRYPGARCDIQSLDYSYTWDPELDAEWTWSEKYATQPEILRYAELVAAKHDLHKGIDFETKVAKAVWDDAASTWRITTSAGETITSTHYVMATGCLSVPKEIDIAGADAFKGETYLTSRWPHGGVDLTGKRVAVIGTGSSAIQSIPVIAKQAAHVTVFQRTPNFSIPAHNGNVPTDKIEALSQDRAGYRQAARESGAGVPMASTLVSALSVPAEEREATYEAAWQRGGIIEFLGCYSDHMSNDAANGLIAEFVRNKIRSTVKDPTTAEALCPTTYPIGTKRLCVDTGYYETFNRDNVRLVDLQTHPIKAVTATGVDLVDESIEVDVVVFATGFDAMTGAIVSVDITGRNGVTLKDAWANGPLTYLGLMAEGFPNLYMVTGPGSPSVLSNMIVSIEQHADWIVNCIDGMRADDLVTIEPTPTAVQGWVKHTNDFANLGLGYKANSWYVGANVPGKPRIYLPYPGGVGRYRKVCDRVVEQDWIGFTRSGKSRTVTNDGVVCRLQPDVMVLLDMMAELGVPPIESLSPTDARMMMTMGAAQRPTGPAVGEIVDATLPGPAGPLNYRLYRPATPGPHPVVVYFHGGGWVLGSQDSDDPLCRDLCVRSGALIVSVDYRHAPEARFPAAADDAFASLQWVASHASELGGDPARIAVAGWSAGGNLAAVVCQLARDAGGPAIVGQLLLTPVTDSDLARPSYVENGDGYVLTANLMRWFWDHYTDESQRSDPRVAPLRAKSLAGLPPAFIVAAEFDPLRDEGIAYVDALTAAGGRAELLLAKGHTHTSIPAVDVLPTGMPVREQMAAALRGIFADAAP